MPQSPSLPNPHPLRHSLSSEDLPEGGAQSSSAISAAGNLPGGTQVRARTMSRSSLLPSADYPETSNPVVELRNCFGLDSYVIEFNGSNNWAALWVNPALGHLRETRVDKLSASELAERALAAKNVLEARRSANVPSDAAPIPIQPSGGEYRNPYQIPVPSSHPDYVNHSRLPQHVNHVYAAVKDFLDEAGMSSLPENWTTIDSDDLEETFTDEPNYYVCGWESVIGIEDPDSPEGCKQRDAQIRDAWKKGEFDRLAGVTFIRFNGGSEWIVWLEDRTAGYNLSTGKVLLGLPSEVYRALEKQGPAMLTGLDQILVAPPAASNALHALQNIAPEKAHRLLVAHCNPTDSEIVEMGFEEFGSVVQRHYPDAVVARYHRQTTDLQALGAVLDAFEGRFILVNINRGGPAAVQDMGIMCFNAPGLKPSWDTDRSTSANAGTKKSPASGKRWFEEGNRTSQEYLADKRTDPFSTVSINARFSILPNTMRRIPQANAFKLYIPSDYSGKPTQYEPPSVILQRHFGNCDQIGIISTGALQAAKSPDTARLARLTESGQADFLKTSLQYAGVNVESADLAREVLRTHGEWPEISADLIKRCVESLKKIKVSLDVTRSAEKLPILGDDPAGCLLQYREKGQLLTVIFYKSEGVAVFFDLFDYTWPVSELKRVAFQQNWWKEGPVTLLRFEGEDVGPLINVPVPPQESVEESSAADEDRKRKRVSTSSIASTTSDLALRPSLRKTERLE